MKRQNKTRENFLKKKFPLWVLILTLSLTIALAFYTHDFDGKKNDVMISAPVTTASVNCNTVIHQQRLKNSQFTSKLLLIDTDLESDKFNDLKSAVQNFLEQQKREGRINSASVYVKKMGFSEWFAVNPDESFYTASIMKVAVMITILKMSETIPGFLDKNYPFRYADPHIASQTYNEPTIIPGNDYKMRELVYRMIVYSDNYASNILNNLMDLNIYTKIFSDIGIEGYDPNDQFRKLTANEVGKLFRLLYNSSYLSEANSEYALSILAKSSFHEGIMKELPADLIVAHKFGEGGGQEENQLGEAGIVYAETVPYLIVIMTRGKQLTDLSQSMAHVSRMVYDYMSK